MHGIGECNAAGRECHGIGAPYFVALFTKIPIINCKKVKFFENFQKFVQFSFKTGKLDV